MDKVTDSKHKEYPSIYRKIRWGFGLMTFAMFTLFWSLIYVAENKLEVLSLHHWLDTEVELYKENYQNKGGTHHCPMCWSLILIGVKRQRRIGYCRLSFLDSTSIF